MFLKLVMQVSVHVDCYVLVVLKDWASLMRQGQLTKQGAHDYL